MKHHFLFKLKNSLITHQMLLYGKKSFVAEVTVKVPNMASVSKDILFHVSKFLEKKVFELMFEIIK